MPSTSMSSAFRSDSGTGTPSVAPDAAQTSSVVDGERTGADASPVSDVRPALVNETTAGESTVLRLSGLDVHRGHVHALQELSVEFAPGECVLICGENGSGKSTLLQAIAGILPYQGAIEAVGGAAIAYVPQLPPLPERLPLRVRDAVAMGRWPKLGLLRRPGAADRAAIDQAIELLGLEDLAERQLSAVSGGQRQRALVAQALVRKAPVVLLDEPTAAADAASREIIHRAAAECAADGALVLLASHDESAREVTNRWIRLEGGRIISDEAGVAEIKPRSAS
ncbi:MAG: ATP-binding cassette domain-containing protein [Actinomycetaceae bacterium]|nr:ATP-binding cassette domain-containing protein [Actinomycetaceae bacterium]